MIKAYTILIWKIISIVLQLLGIPENVTREQISLCFRSANFSGGGDIDTLELESDEGKAIVVYKDPQGMVMNCNYVIVIN